MEKEGCCIVHCVIDGLEDGLEEAFQVMMLLWKERCNDKLESSVEILARRT